MNMLHSCHVIPAYNLIQAEAFLPTCSKKLLQLSCTVAPLEKSESIFCVYRHTQERRAISPQRECETAHPAKENKKYIFEPMLSFRN